MPKSSQRSKKELKQFQITEDISFQATVLFEKITAARRWFKRHVKSDEMDGLLHSMESSASHFDAEAMECHKRNITTNIFKALKPRKPKKQ